MATRDDALTLAAAGWAILPLRGKVPTTPHGVLDASTDPTQIAEWWPAGAQRNIGARVPDALLVIDVDPQNGGDLAALEAATATRLPDTLTVVSGRGTGGEHRYYLHPGGNVSARRLPPGIDVKTSTGYCVMPPSLHPATGRPYVWRQAPPAALPSAVVDLLRTIQRRTTLPRATAPAGTLDAKAAYLARFVEQLGEGERNRGLFWAACRAVEDGHPQASFDLLAGAAMVAGLDEREADATIASARRGGDRS